ncbi:hypothetical protein TSUD_40960 [Trifolium subterraneum]|nr:hypothetical protein TSUD_40960 [Trifolium subterraneum]
MIDIYTGLGLRTTASADKQMTGEIGWVVVKAKEVFCVGWWANVALSGCPTTTILNLTIHTHAREL